MPAKPVTRTEREALAEQRFEEIRRELGQVPMQCPRCGRDWYGLRDTACRPICAGCGTPVTAKRPSK